MCKQWVGIKRRSGIPSSVDQFQDLKFFCTDMLFILPTSSRVEHDSQHAYAWEKIRKIGIPTVIPCPPGYEADASVILLTVDTV